MRFIADFHIHSKYSRATSKSTDLDNLAKWAKIKGIKVLGAGDFTHPLWLSHLKGKLIKAEPGLFKLKKGDNGTRFMLTSEISCIYKKNDKVRKIHIIVTAPSFEIVDKINKELAKIGNLKSDGRPILGLDAERLAEIVLSISKDCLIIPAHAMTPWFAIFGSKSGFDSIEECFGKYSKYIYAIETGLSADPEMLWRIPDGRKVALISNSDAHSPQKLGREANVFNTELDYYSIFKAIKTKNPKKFLYTIEFYPEEGKYHLDGHRSCDIRLNPNETKKYNGLCPVCGKPLTVGVLNRISEIADKPEGYKPTNAIPFKSLVPLEEIIADVLGKGVSSKCVQGIYNKLIGAFDSEFYILLESSAKELEKTVDKDIASAILKVRKGEVSRSAGYDGVFGKISVHYNDNEKNCKAKQNTLF